MVFVFSIFMRLFSFRFFRDFATAVGETSSIIAISLWLSFSPALEQIRENISLSSAVNLSLCVSILVYTCKLKFIRFLFGAVSPHRNFLACFFKVSINQILL